MNEEMKKLLTGIRNVIDSTIETVEFHEIEFNAEGQPEDEIISTLCSADAIKLRDVVKGIDAALIETDKLTQDELKELQSYFEGKELLEGEIKGNDLMSHVATLSSGRKVNTRQYQHLAYYEILK